MKHSILPEGVCLSLLALLVGCQSPGPAPQAPRAEIRNNIIESAATGRADDGDSENPEDDYRLPDRDAQDRQTSASSAMPKFNELSGAATAMPRDPAAATIVKDLALAVSTNRVVTDFVVTTEDAFTFNTKLAVEGIRLVGEGTVLVNVQAVILQGDGTVLLDENGDVDPKGALTGAANFRFRNDGSGSVEVIIDSDEENPDGISEAGTYEVTQRGPNGGVQLKPGKYRLELNLRLRARAPIGRDANGDIHSARVEKATLSIELR